MILEFLTVMAAGTNLIVLDAELRRLDHLVSLVLCRSLSMSRHLLQTVWPHCERIEILYGEILASPHLAQGHRRPRAHSHEEWCTSSTGLRKHSKNRRHRQRWTSSIGSFRRSEFSSAESSDPTDHPISIALLLFLLTVLNIFLDDERLSKG
jgi:hypothetical protein